MPPKLVPFAVNRVFIKAASTVSLTTIEAPESNRRWLKREDIDGFIIDSFIVLENRVPTTFCFYMFRVKTTDVCSTLLYCSSSMNPGDSTKGTNYFKKSLRDDSIQ